MALCASVRIAAGVNVMKGLLVFLTLAALSIGCYKEHRPQLRSVKELATEPTTWNGRPGTAVTIQFKEGTEQFMRSEMVSIDFAPPDRKQPFVSISDFHVPVMKREPQALTLFFTNDHVLEHLPEQFEAGTLGVSPCNPMRVCGGTVYYVGSSW